MAFNEGSVALGGLNLRGLQWSFGLANCKIPALMLKSSMDRLSRCRRRRHHHHHHHHHTTQSTQHGGPQMVRLQCHEALAAPAPKLSPPSVHDANVRRFRNTICDHKFNPVQSLLPLTVYWCSGLYYSTWVGGVVLACVLTMYALCVCVTCGGGGGGVELLVKFLLFHPQKAA